MPITNSLFGDTSSDEVLMTLTNARIVTFGDGQKMAVIIDHSNEFLMTLCAC